MTRIAKPTVIGELPESQEETEAERLVREGDARVAEASESFDVERLEEELLRRV